VISEVQEGSPKFFQGIGMLAGQISFADVRKGIVPPQMGQKCTFQAAMFGQVNQSGIL
jgi:hypothetical protein